MSHSDSASKLDKDISIHIFTVSSAMLGVCLTVIGLIRIVITIKNIDTLADDILAIDAILFLTSCILSYSALRTRSTKRLHSIEKIADTIFIIALILMAVVSIIIVYAMSVYS
jgi:hypothetical protein